MFLVCVPWGSIHLLRVCTFFCVRKSSFEVICSWLRIINPKWPPFHGRKREKNIFVFSSYFFKLYNEINCFQNKKNCPLINVKYVMKCHRPGAIPNPESESKDESESESGFDSGFGFMCSGIGFGVGIV